MVRTSDANDGDAAPRGDGGPRLPALGRRGGGWVAGQGVLLAAVFLSALVGVGWPAPLAPLGYAVAAALLAAGVALLVAGGSDLGTALTPFPAPRAGEALRTAGAYRLVRHPIYGGVVLVALGWSALFGSVVGAVLTVLLALFLDLKSRREEHWLERHYPGYRDYRRRTRRRFLPFVW